MVDEQILQPLLREQESILATLEILADRELTERLLTLAQTIDADMENGKLIAFVDAFGQ